MRYEDAIAKRPGWRIKVRRAVFAVLQHVTPCPACKGLGTERIGEWDLECSMCRGKATYAAFAEQYARDIATFNGHNE